MNGTLRGIVQEAMSISDLLDGCRGETSIGPNLVRDTSMKVI